MSTGLLYLIVLPALFCSSTYSMEKSVANEKSRNKKLEGYHFLWRRKDAGELANWNVLLYSYGGPELSMNAAKEFFVSEFPYKQCYEIDVRLLDNPKKFDASCGVIRIGLFYPKPALNQSDNCFTYQNIKDVLKNQTGLYAITIKYGEVAEYELRVPTEQDIKALPSWLQKDTK